MLDLMARWLTRRTRIAPSAQAGALAGTTARDRARMRRVGLRATRYT